MSEATKVKKTKWGWVVVGMEHNPDCSYGPYQTKAAALKDATSTCREEYNLITTQDRGDIWLGKMYQPDPMQFLPDFESLVDQVADNIRDFYGSSHLSFSVQSVEEYEKAVGELAHAVRPVFEKYTELDWVLDIDGSERVTITGAYKSEDEPEGDFAVIVKTVTEEGEDDYQLYCVVKVGKRNSQVYSSKDEEKAQSYADTLNHYFEQLENRKR